MFYMYSSAINAIEACIMAVDAVTTGLLGLVAFKYERTATEATIIASVAVLQLVALCSESYCMRSRVLDLIVHANVVDWTFVPCQMLLQYRTTASKSHALRILTKGCSKPLLKNYNVEGSPQADDVTAVIMLQLFRLLKQMQLAM